jgi:leader peptidase (prepilin peptidase)/N-methyltransferase
VELLTAGITYLIYSQVGFTTEFYYILLIVYTLIALSFIDLKFKAVPDSLLIIITSITLIYLFTNKIENLSTFFIFAGAIIIIDLFVTYYIQNIKAKILKNDFLKTQKAIGEGDIPIIAIIGGLLGLEFGLIAIFISAILAIIPSVLNIILNKEIETPFIPFLTIGFLITYTNTDTIQKILEGLNIL